jgi:predicted outer membrane lipoprotein
MVYLAWVLGTLGGLSAVMGIITATEAVPAFEQLPAPFTAMFWLTLAVVLMLSCIAAVLSRTEYE